MVTNQWRKKCQLPTLKMLMFERRRKSFTTQLVLTETSRRSKSSKPTSEHDAFAHVPNDPNGDVCKVTMTARAQCGRQLDARNDRALRSNSFCRCHFVDCNILTGESESRWQSRYPVVVQGLFTKRIQKLSLPKRSPKEGTMMRLQRFRPLDRKPKNNPHRQYFLEFATKCVGRMTRQPHVDPRKLRKAHRPDFHPRTVSSKKCILKHVLCPLFGSPKAGDASHEDLLKVERREFWS